VSVIPVMMRFNSFDGGSVSNRYRRRPIWQVALRSLIGWVMAADVRRELNKDAQKRLMRWLDYLSETEKRHIVRAGGFSAIVHRVIVAVNFSDALYCLPSTKIGDGRGIDHRSGCELSLM
jgi:hypothetical protein